MTILVTGDLHLNSNPRDQYRHDWQKQLRTLTRKHRVGCVVILGDLCDEKDRHPAVLVNQVVQHLHDLSAICEVVILKGNHDYTSLADTPFFAFVARLGHVYWIGSPGPTPTDKNLPTTSLQRLGRVLWLPHTPNYQRDWRSEEVSARWDYIFAHNTFEGAAVGKRKLEGIPLDTFHKKSKVISGDIHVPQAIGQLTYCGSPYTIDFGEDFTPRVLLIKDDGSVVSIKSPGPQKRQVELGSLKEGHPIINFVDVKELIAPGDLVRLRIHLGAGEYAKWDEIKKAAAMDFEDTYHCTVYQAIPISSNKTRRMVSKREVSIKSDKDLITEYARRLKIDERTLKTGLEFLKEDYRK